MPRRSPARSARACARACKDLELSRKLATLDCEPSSSNTTPESLVRARAGSRNACASCTRASSCARCCVSLSGGAASADAAARRRRPQLRVGSRCGRAAGELRVDPHAWRTLAALDRAAAGAPSCSRCTSKRLRSTTCEAEIVGHRVLRRARQRGVRSARTRLRRRAGAALTRRGAAGCCKPLLESEQPPKIGHHLKYDAHVLKRDGIELRGMRFDSMLESYVWNSTATRHELDAVARKLSRLRHDPLRRPDRPRREADRASARSPIDVGDEIRRRERRRRRCSCIACCGRSIAGVPALQHAVRSDRAAARAGAVPDGAGRRADRRRAAAAAEPRAGARACARSKRRRTRRRAGRSRSNRRSSCRKCCSASSGCRCCARLRPASRRRRKTCWRSSRKNTSCRG